MNAACQPYFVASHGTTIGAANAPMLVPAFTKPNANARSLRGNHSEIVLVQAGKFGDSATPKNARASRNPVKVLANACDIDATLHAISATAKPVRTPIRSSKAPDASCPKAYDSANADWM